MTDKEYTSLRVTEERREQLKDKQKHLLADAHERPHMVDLDDEDNLPSVDATIKWLCSIHEAGHNMDRRSKYNGKIQGYVSALLDHTPDEDLDFSNGDWTSLDGARILYALTPSAHHWQIVEDEETGERVLDGAADPTDISLAVFDNGYILDGGPNPVLIHDDEAVDRIRNMVERRDEAIEEIDETVFHPDV